MAPSRFAFGGRDSHRALFLVSTDFVNERRLPVRFRIDVVVPAAKVTFATASSLTGDRPQLPEAAVTSSGNREYASLDSNAFQEEWLLRQNDRARRW